MTFLQRRLSQEDVQMEELLLSRDLNKLNLQGSLNSTKASLLTEKQNYANLLLEEEISWDKVINSLNRIEALERGIEKGETLLKKEFPKNEKID